MTSAPDPASTGPRVAWTPAGSYPTRAVAQLAASILQGHGFDVRVVGDDAGGVLPHLDSHRGGVEVQVPAGDVEDAIELLADLDRPSSSAPGALGRSRWRTVVMLLVAAAVLTAVALAFLGGPDLTDL